MLEKIKNSEFAKNVIVLFSGSFLSQMIPFFILPILQKYFYEPSDFGLLAIFISFFELFAKAATLKLEYGIVIQRKTRNAINLVFGALRVSWVITLISLIFVCIFKNNIANHFQESNLANYFFLLPIYILVTSFNDIASYWFNWKKKFSTISFSKVVQTTSAEGSKILMGLLNFNFIGLISGRIIGFCIASLYYVHKFIKTDVKSLKLLNRKESNRMIKENRKFIFYTTPSVFIGSLINLTYLNLFLIHFGQDIVGNISVSMVYLSSGFGVISISFSQVFYSKIAEATDPQKILSMYKRFAKNLMFIAIIPVLFVYLIPTSLVTHLLGKEWSELVSISRIMVLWLSVWFVSASLSFIYIRMGRQKEMVFFDILHLVVIVVSFYIGITIKNDVYYALWAFSIGQIVFYLFAIYIAIYFIRKFKI
jgi:lipopolysaccharide exporter